MLFKRKKKVDEVKQKIGDIVQSLNLNALCFTGHRSQKLSWWFDESHERCIAMKKELERQLIVGIEKGYDTSLVEWHLVLI